MSEMGSDEVAVEGAGRLNDALVQFTGCVAAAVPDICSYGLTIGESYVPFDPDEDDECDADEVMCSQLWVRVTSIMPQAQESWGGDCAATLQIGLEVGVLRCLDIPEDGEAPTATDVLVAAMQANSDMAAIYCAAMSCDVPDFSSITSQGWTPEGPLGGQYGGVWNFTVEF